MRLLEMTTDADASKRAAGAAQQGDTLLSVGELTALTGTGRERLRSWERRHGFPMPVREAGSTRRYPAEVVRQVVFVRRAVESGVPVPDAIAQLPHLPDSAPDTLADWSAALEHAPLPVLAVGPTEVGALRVVWANVASQCADDSPPVGEPIGADRLGVAAYSRLRDVLMGSDRTATVIELQDGHNALPGPVRALAWRLPPHAQREPAVVVQWLAQNPEPRRVPNFAAPRGP